MWVDPVRWGVTGEPATDRGADFDLARLVLVDGPELWMRS